MARLSRRLMLTIVELCLSTGRGGLEGYAAGLVPALAERGHRLRVVAFPGSEFAARTGKGATLEITASRWTPWRGGLQLARLCREADILHIHRSADLPLAVLAKRLSGCRPALIYSRHMAIPRDRRNSPVHRLLHREVDRMLVVSERLAGEARSRLPIDPSRIQLLYPGVEPGRPASDCRAFRPPGVDFVVGCFSRLEAAKGQRTLLAALARLVGAGINAGGVLAGPVMDFGYEESLRRMSQSPVLADRIRFVGALTDARPAMACCDAVVLPSAAETLGLVLVEAQLMGVAVLGGDAGGVREIIRDGETGLLFAPGDEAALAARLARLAREPGYAATLARAGAAAARMRFNRAAHLDHLEALFRAVTRG